MAFEQIRSLTRIEIIHNLLERRLRQPRFQSLKEHGDKLLDILLHHNIDRLVSKGFIRNTEIPSIIVNPVTGLQIGEDSLELVQEIVVDLSELVFGVHGGDEVGGLGVIRAEYKVTEVFVHEELLDHGVYVAGVAEVF